MIISEERDDSIVYESVAQHDFENIVHTAYILFKQPYNRLERVSKGGIVELQLISYDSNGESKLVIAEYDEQEQEMTVYF